MESEGIDRGSCATFIVKLGMCNNQSDPCGRQVAPRGRPNHGSDDLIGHRQVFRDNDGAVPSISRYQRSL